MNDTDYFWPSTVAEFMEFVRRDIQANKRDPKTIIVLLFLRICQYAMGDRWRPRRLSYPLIIGYRFLTEFILGMELRPKTSVGPGLKIFHGFGLVVNDHCNIGANVHLRNGVTIGNRQDSGGVPVLGDGVHVGAGAIIIGDIIIGDHARIGAGSVVLQSVQPAITVVGNPAKAITVASTL